MCRTEAGCGRTHPHGPTVGRLAAVRVPTHRSVLPVLMLAVLATYATAQSTPADSREHEGFWARWFKRSDHSKSEQRHWLTPLATTTPRLEQEVRYDVNWSQPKPGGPYIETYGNTKGLELIPFEQVEIIAAIPPYVVHNNP